jgi:hypothetical protein
MIRAKIKNLFKKVIRKISRQIFKIDVIFQDEFSDLERVIEIEYGHFKSRENKLSIDNDENPIPWFTYPSIEYLKQLDLKNFNCLEWGCGNSSLFFAQKTKHITSIEDNENWFHTVDKKIKELCIYNADILFAKNEKEYIYPSIEDKYDLIIIDGKYRMECIYTAIKLFSGKGFIILDNSNRYPDLCKIFRDNKFLQVDFIGFGPIVDFTTQTTFFFSVNSFSNIKIQAKLPIIGNPNNY